MSVLTTSRSARAKQLAWSSIPHIRISSIRNKRPDSNPPFNPRAPKFRKPMNYIKSHPYKTIIITTCVLTSLAPSIASSPILSLLGLGDHGPIFGGLAAQFQAYSGKIASNGVFATLQSAAMGGEGADVFDLIISGTSIAVGLTTVLWNKIRRLGGRGRR